MNAADVMVSNVITVGSDATVQEVVGILLRLKTPAPDNPVRGSYRTGWLADAAARFSR